MLVKSGNWNLLGVISSFFPSILICKYFFFISCNNNFSVSEIKSIPFNFNNLFKYSLTSSPPKSLLIKELGIEHPFKIEQICETPSPLSKITPVVSEKENNDKDDYYAKINEGTLYFSNKIVAIFSLFSFGFKSGSVINKGC